MFFSSKDRAELKLLDEKHMGLWLYSEYGNGFKAGPCSYSLCRFPDKIPEKQIVSRHEYRYKIPITDTNLEYLKPLLSEQCEVDPVIKLAFLQHEVSVKKLQSNIEIVARYHAKNILPICGHVEHKEFPLAPYQKVARYNSFYNDGYGLFMEQGTGKTPVVISLIDQLAKKDFVRVLIVAPKNVRSNWVSEFEKFSTVKGRVTVIRGEKIARESDLLKALFPSDGNRYSVVIVSWETLTRSQEAFTFNADSHLMQTLTSVAGSELNLKWDLAVCDESHYGKNHKAKRTKAMLALRDASKKRLALTGTPMSGTILDLWSQLEFLGRGYSGFSNYTAFKDFYGVYRLDELGYKTLDDFQNIPYLQDILARRTFMIKKAEALPNLPEKLYDRIECSLTPEQYEVYKKVCAQIVVEAENELSNTERPREMTVNNILTKMLRLSQITSGFVTYDAQYSDDGELISEKQVDRFDPDPKLEALVEAIKGHDQKIIVWAHWTQNIKTIAARLKLEGIDCVTFYGGTSDEDREIAKKRFNCDPKCKVLIGNPGAGGAGLNLLGYDYSDPRWVGDAIPETYCNWEIYYSQDWTPTKRSQSEDRAHRRGTKCRLRITDLMVPGSIDEEIRRRVTAKIKGAIQVADIRKILDSVFVSELAINGD